MPAFETALSSHFPGAVRADTFIEETQRLLFEQGFKADNAMACVCFCRDEITRPLARKVERAWGEAFSISSLAGMVFIGRTGFSAILSHLPSNGGRQRCVFFVLPHIGIDASGETGRHFRRGQSETSDVCGSLVAFREELLGGKLMIEHDPDDLEQCLVKRRLVRNIRYGTIPDLVTLTKKAREIMLADVERQISLNAHSNEVDYAMLSGVHVHGPDDEYVWPAAQYIVREGERIDLAVPVERPASE